MRDKVYVLVEGFCDGHHMLGAFSSSHDAMNAAQKVIDRKTQRGEYVPIYIYELVIGELGDMEYGVEPVHYCIYTKECNE